MNVEADHPKAKRIYYATMGGWAQLGVHAIPVVGLSHPSVVELSHLLFKKNYWFPSVYKYLECVHPKHFVKKRASF
jgi:hypothetical protein